MKNRLLQRGNKIDLSLAESVELAYLDLTNSKSSAFTTLLESFFQLSGIHAVKGLNEAAFRTVIETLWFKPGSRVCLAELCLVANKDITSGHGRFAFVDIFFPEPPHPVLFELKNATLEGLYRGCTGKDPKSDSELESLRKKLKTTVEDELLNWKVAYRYREGQAWKWAQKTIGQLKEEASDQAKRYMSILKNQKPKGEGVHDNRIQSATGNCTLTGYVAICVGGTRVLAWSVGSAEVGCKFLANPL